MSHGVITLERSTLQFGASRRRCQVQKMRGVSFVEGFHDVTITRGSFNVFPRLVAAEIGF